MKTQKRQQQQQHAGIGLITPRVKRANEEKLLSNNNALLCVQSTSEQHCRETWQQLGNSCVLQRRLRNIDLCVSASPCSIGRTCFA
ncbi:Protein of unknown function [Gryllus bimaculatus]|nr:Protein of unknown function [Gryllus bimaculatus]